MPLLLYGVYTTRAALLSVSSGRVTMLAIGMACMSFSSNSHDSIAKLEQVGCALSVASKPP